MFKVHQELYALSVQRDHSVEHTLDSFISHRKTDYTRACLKFIMILDAVDEKEKKTLLRNLVEGTLRLRDLAEALETTKEELVDRLSKIHPHPVYVQTGGIPRYLQSYVMSQQHTIMYRELTTQLDETNVAHFADPSGAHTDLFRHKTFEG